MTLSIKAIVYLIIALYTDTVKIVHRHVSATKKNHFEVVRIESVPMLVDMVVVVMRVH